VALTLGGGPRATTVELAIFQAFTYDFDLGRAALLALVQVGLTVAAAALALRIAVPAVLGAGLDRAVERWDAAAPGPRAADALWLAVVSAFLLLPLAAVVAAGAAALPGLPPQVWAAAGRSLVVALGSAALTLALALPLALLVERLRGRAAGALTEGLGYLTVAASPLVMGTGLFVILYPLADPAALALPVTATVNAAMALPFALRAILPALREAEDAYGRLADSLRLTGGARLRVLILPRLRRPLGFAAGIAAAFSMGDLGVIALFADAQTATLPLQLYRLMAAYRMDDAMGAALLLMGATLALFWAFDRGGRMRA
jgi:thiamine transport system permease protein